jgi:hypothetical protein
VADFVASPYGAAQKASRCFLFADNPASAVKDRLCGIGGGFAFTFVIPLFSTC